jgi:hypothetical protein
LNGKLNGKCTYIKTDAKTKKTLIKETAFFEQNVQIGNCEYQNCDNDINLKYSTDSNGLYNGDYKATSVINGIKYEEIRNYVHSILISGLLTNLSNGNIIWKVENGKEIINKKNEEDSGEYDQFAYQKFDFEEFLLKILKY